MAKFRLAFTWIELLVVLVIIAILSALITGTSDSCFPRRPQAAITLEIQQLGSAFVDFKYTYGEYPPNLMASSIAEMPNQSAMNPRQAALRMFKKAFPRSKEPESVILALAGKSGESGITTSLPDGIMASEAIFFWLGGFSQDTQYPLSGLGGPSFSDGEGNNDGVLNAKDEKIENRHFYYEFDLGRLGPRTSHGNFDDGEISKGKGRFIEYDDPRDGVRRRINFWQYFPPGSTLAYVYFDTSRDTPAEYYPRKSSLLPTNVAPLKRLREGANPDSPSREDFLFVNQGKFQILHAGLDDVWGDFSGIRSGAVFFPRGPFQSHLADTQANFLIGILEDEQE